MRMQFQYSYKSLFSSLNRDLHKKQGGEVFLLLLLLPVWELDTELQYILYISFNGYWSYDMQIVHIIIHSV